MGCFPVRFCTIEGYAGAWFRGLLAATSHYWSRELQPLGHKVRLMLPAIEQQRAGSQAILDRFARHVEAKRQV